MQVPQLLHWEDYTLDKFCVFISMISCAYTTIVAVWSIGFGESELFNWRLIKHVLASCGLVNMTWLMFSSGTSLGMWRIPLLSLMGMTAMLSGIMTYRTHIMGRAPEHVDMQGKVVVVTGANAGIGLETAKALMGMGAHVILACRSEERAKEAIETMTRGLLNVAALERPRGGVPTLRGKATFMPLDLCSLKSVRNFATEYRKRKLPLDVLVLNAGVMMGRRTVTEDGFETTFAVNHLAHFLLARELLPLVERSAEGRIVILTSALHKSVKAFDFDDVQTEQRYSMFKAYSKSKLANVMFGIELHKRLQEQGSKVMVNMVHPGMVLSDISKNMRMYMRVLEELVRPILVLLRKLPVHGAYTSVYVATSPDLRRDDGSAISGQYFFDSYPQMVAEAARYNDDRERLWTLSEQLCGAKFKFS
ncbi:hypothetical protein JKP88DRAFT_269076 [Tribonema minus]|uniref:Uncharacterized protein n=1 Tax=Tribonema minus TaxID=303371 RepID=A0A835YQM3_9STRA|nr:hypothetical protein JKP88DRAFT_269076 [Tribonema minus]